MYIYVYIYIYISAFDAEYGLVGARALPSSKTTRSSKLPSP